jgi:hypothetical protein
MKKPKLSCELIPSTTHYNNVRSILSQSIWDKLRKTSYSKANFKCQICKESGLDQGYKHALECHETWEYTADGIQLLTGLISLCPRCHQSKHIGRALAMKRKTEMFKHMMKVNKWTKDIVEAYVGACFQDHKERSKIKWKLDIRILSEKYGVDKTLITEYITPKKVTKPKWKSKKRKKKKTVSKKKTVARKIPRKK